MKESIRKSKILLEAMPYIQAFQDKVFVIKYGGSAISNAAAVERVLKDMVFLNLVGIRPVLVHGGGPFITKRMRKENKKVEFIGGQRKTDAHAVKIVDEVLSKLNKQLVKKIDSCGGKAKGILGRQNLIRAKKLSALLGYIGKVSSVNTKPIKDALKKGMIPVISPVAKGVGGGIYNVNADQIASAISKSLKAEKLVLVTDVVGIMKKKMLIPSLTIKQTRKSIKSGVIHGGMIPKVTACMDAIRGGVGKAHIISANLPHSLLLEIFTNKGIGTEIIK